MGFILDVFRALVRIFALIILVMGLFALFLLGNAIVQGDGRVSQALGKVWFQDDLLRPLLGTPSIQLVQVFFERKLAMPFLWDPLVTTLLNWPTWLVLGVGGVGGLVLANVIFAVTRRKKPEPAPKLLI